MGGGEGVAAAGRVLEDYSSAVLVFAYYDVLRLCRRAVCIS